jgi:hypothetical protein
MDCRILVAFDASAKEAITTMAQTEGEARIIDYSKTDGFLVGSFGHDINGECHSLPLPTTGKLPSCASDIAVIQFALLPSPFNHWITMTYHIKAGVPEGLLEIWADRVHIANVSGRIGYADSASDIQYFKFGPYRDPTTYDIQAFITRYRRGSTRADVDDGD